ncbi:MAG TPA: hypothetical protein VFS71_03250 [Flavobacterium sp.]|uniref:hypothetical protein n=1 Tax=Flavobacterium sp. TaxID=239 RepID=UPI002DB94741|nr:hypothetical protein [Flavobacterium sp.]HEU4788679.1 hypothetical protein [Flavobacterium sp.]
MKIKNRIVLGFSLILSVLLVWYLFVKECDYCISFEIKTSTGTVFQGIQEWSNVQLKNDKERYTILEKRNFDFIRQEMVKGKTKMEYNWEMKYVNDSTTKVNVGIKELNHSIYNRLTAPFFKTPFKEEQIKKIVDFRNGLDNFLKNFKVKIKGEVTSQEAFVAYINIKCVLQEKAQSLIMRDGDITGFLRIHNIKIIGRPYIEIVNWDLDKEKLVFNYCFPINKNTQIIEDSIVKFKTLKAVKGLGASYFGSYRTSDRAWFALRDYAKENGYELENTPLERYLANPFDGGDELTWEAQIVIPFKKK